MPVGCLNPMPFRLGGTERNGLTAEQHARLAADYVALKRAGTPLAVWTYTLASGVVTVNGFHLGQNGVGSAFEWEPTVMGTGDVLWEWPSRNFVDALDDVAPITIRWAEVGVHGSASRKKSFELTANSIRVRTFTTAGAAADAKVTVEVY